MSAIKNLRNVEPCSGKSCLKKSKRIFLEDCIKTKDAGCNIEEDIFFITKETTTRGSKKFSPHKFLRRKLYIIVVVIIIMLMVAGSQLVHSWPPCVGRW